MMSSTCTQNNGDGESQAETEILTSPDDTITTTEEVSRTPPLITKNMSTPEKEKINSPTRSESPIGDDACPICLGEITDMCKADSCFHGFCFICLKEWSKQKAVCPLCKQKFTKIMYNIKSETDYKEWKVPVPDPQQQNNTLNLNNFREFLNVENRRFFGYHTTNFPGALALHRHFPRRGQNFNNIPDAIPPGPRERRPSRFNLRGSSMFRLSVYLNNVWVQPLADITGRYRQTAPELYREQPALTHRLAPWVNRELTALLPEPRIAAVLREMMQLIEQYPINSREFRRAVLPHLGRRTNHFVHEFYNFARSPYDMVGHDNAAQYIPRYDNVNDSDSSSSSDDSDAIVEVDSSGIPISSSDANLPAAAAAAGTIVPVVRQETLTNEGSVVISSGSSSSSSSSSSEDESANLRSNGLSSETHNPEPPSHFMRRLIKRARTFLTTVNSGASTSNGVQAESGSSASSSSRVTAADSGIQSNKPEQGDDSDDSTACMIVDEVSTRGEFPPELINLSSDEEGDEGISKRLQRRGKTKPSLLRNNFANRKPEEQDADHTYCTADSTSTGGTTSNTSNSQNIQTKKRECIRISEAMKKSNLDDSDYVPGDSMDESISLSSSDTASSSHSEWGPSSSRISHKKRSRRQLKNRADIANTRLNKKRAESDSQSESESKSDSDSDWGTVSDKVSYSRYLKRINKNKSEIVNGNIPEINNIKHKRRLASRVSLNELRVPPIPSSSHDIDSNSRVLDSLSEGESSVNNSTSLKSHKNSSKTKDSPSKVKKSFSLKFNNSSNIKQGNVLDSLSEGENSVNNSTSLKSHKNSSITKKDNPSKVKKSSLQINNSFNIKKEKVVNSGIEQEQILRSRILARQNLLDTKIGDDISDKSPDVNRRVVSLAGSSSEKSQRAQSPSESSQYSQSSRKKDHSSKIKKSSNKVKKEYHQRPSESYRQLSIASSHTSENHQNSVDPQSNRKRSRKSSKEKKRKKRKREDKEKHKEREKTDKEKHTEREKSEKEKHKEREKTDKEKHTEREKSDKEKHKEREKTDKEKHTEREKSDKEKHKEREKTDKEKYKEREKSDKEKHKERGEKSKRKEKKKKRSKSKKVRRIESSSESNNSDSN